MKTNSLDEAIARVTVIDFRWAVETGGDAFARVHDNAERKGSKGCHFGKPAALLAKLTPAPTGRQRSRSQLSSSPSGWCRKDLPHD
jgi:hypothetical protein